jgi:hypothetical protein
MRQATLSTPTIARAGLLGGLAGAVLIDAYLLLIYVVLGHASTLTAFYQYVASGAVGKAAYADPSYAWLGLALHLAVSLTWGVGFAYVGARTPQVLARPLVSGLVFGIVVLIAMWLIEFAAAIWIFPSASIVEHALVSHLIFFGLPVAYVVSRELRPA